MSTILLKLWFEVHSLDETYVVYCFSFLGANFEQVNTKHILDGSDTMEKNSFALLASTPRSDMSTRDYDVSNNRFGLITIYCSVWSLAWPELYLD